MNPSRQRRFFRGFNLPGKCTRVQVDLASIQLEITNLMISSNKIIAQWLKDLPQAMR